MIDALRVNFTTYNMVRKNSIYHLVSQLRLVGQNMCFIPYLASVVIATIITIATTQERHDNKPRIFYIIP